LLLFFLLCFLPVSRDNVWTNEERIADDLQSTFYQYYLDKYTLWKKKKYGNTNGHANDKQA